MGRRSFGLTSLLLGLTACSGSVGAGGSGGGGTTGSTTSMSSGSTATSSGTTTPPLGAAAVITMDSFMVPPGGEVYYCQDFANPFGGMDANIQMFESHMSKGSHHLLLFYKDGVTSDGPIEKCSGLEFAATPYGSQAPDDSLEFPPGVAALVPGTSGLRIQSHYLNTTNTAIDAKVQITLHQAAAGTVQNQAGVLFVVDPKFMIQPNSSAVVMDDCTIPQDMNVLRANSHMHQHGTNFVATVGGSSVYQTTQWSEPKSAIFDPPMAFKAGDPLHFACSFTNNSSSTLTFGESAQTNEMCIFTAVFYPAPPGQATITANQCKMTQM